VSRHEAREIGVVAERQDVDSPWCDHRWRVTGLLPGAPAVPPWTLLGAEPGVRRYFAGNAVLELYPLETDTLRHNIEGPQPAVYVFLRATDAAPGRRRRMWTPGPTWWSPCRCRTTCMPGSRTSWPGTMSSAPPTSGSATGRNTPLPGASLCRKGKRMSSVGPAPEDDGAASEGLLRRWARRKQAAKAQPAAQAPATASDAAPDAPQAEEPVPVLPDLDTLDASSDYSAFLQRGVPAELQRMALQRAWSSDAAIAEFRGMAEYAWDFNAPQYGQLWAVDDVAKLIQAVTAPPPDALTTPVDAVAAAPDALVDAAPGPEAVADNAVEAVNRDDAAPLPRRHGSALPC